MNYYFMKCFRKDKKSKPTTKQTNNQILAVERFLRFSKVKMTREIPFTKLILENAVNNNTELGQEIQTYIVKYKKSLESSSLTPEQREIMALTIEDLHLSQNQVQGMRNLVCL